MSNYDSTFYCKYAKYKNKYLNAIENMKGGIHARAATQFHQTS